MIRIAIVEDELSYINQLKSFLGKYEKESGNKFEIEVFFDGEDLLEFYSGKYDIILMDIQMRFMNGMKTAEKVRQKDKEVIIMFITNMTQYAIKGYEVDALDYILKPVSYFAFTQRIERAIDRMKKHQKNFLSIIVENGVQKIDISKIHYIESHGHNLLYHTTHGEYSSYGKMKDMEETLVEYDFFRSNKGYLVNLEHVEGIRDGCAIIAAKSLVISRPRKTLFMEALANHISGVIN